MNLLRLTMMLIFIAGSVPASAEFYKYVDENGVALFTDDLSRVPVDQRPGVKEFTESHSVIEDKKPMDIDGLKKLLEDRKQKLDTEYQELMLQEARLEEEGKDAKTNEEIKNHNQKILGFNEKSRKYLENKNAYEKQAAAYRKRVKMEKAGGGQGAGDPDAAIVTPADTEPEETPLEASEQSTEEIPAMRTRLASKKQELDQEYQALLKEKKQVAAEKKNIKTYDDTVANNAKITELNAKIKKHEEKQKAFNQEVDTFNARLEQALKETPK